jgi:hypothetical protein
MTQIGGSCNDESTKNELVAFEVGSSRIRFNISLMTKSHSLLIFYSFN